MLPRALETNSWSCGPRVTRSRTTTEALGPGGPSYGARSCPFIGCCRFGNGSGLCAGRVFWSVEAWGEVHLRVLPVFWTRSRQPPQVVLLAISTSTRCDLATKIALPYAVQRCHRPAKDATDGQLSPVASSLQALRARGAPWPKSRAPAGASKRTPPAPSKRDAVPSERPQSKRRAPAPLPRHLTVAQRRLEVLAF